MIEIWGTYFACDECPLCEDLEWRLRSAQEHGYEPQLDYCWCDKIDGKFYAGGYCEDAFYGFPPKKKKGKRKTGAAYRRAMAVQKKESLIRMLNCTPYNPHAGYVDWDWVDNIWRQVGTYVKYPKNSNRQRFYKRYTNRRIRRGAETGSGKAGYKRCFDYWWELY